MPEQLTIHNARLHNLKNVTVSIPKNQFVVLTGLSGSGKSTLGFDILNKEGQRQYLESLGLVPGGLAKPPVDAIVGLSPTISVDQRLTNRSPRSTVGTATEVFTFLRVLFARLGHRPCPACGRDVPPPFTDADWAGDADDESPAPEATFPCPHCGAPVPELGMANFSFNKPDGACPTCTGLGMVHQANIARLIDEEKSIPEGAVHGWEEPLIAFYTPAFQAAAAHYGFEFDLSRPLKEYTQPQRDLLLYGADSPQFRRHFPTIDPPSTVRKGRLEGVATNLLRRYAERIHDLDYRDRMAEFLIIQTCPDCDGTRLKLESRAVTLHGRTIIDLSQLALNELGAWLAALPAALSADEMLLAGPILEDLRSRIGRLVEVGTTTAVVVDLG